MRKKLIIITYIMVFIIITITVGKFLSDDILFGNDLFIFANPFSHDNFMNTDGFISDCIAFVFLKYIPLLTNIHPHAFSTGIAAFIRGFDVALLCFVISLFPFAGRTKNILLPLFGFLAFVYFCCASANMDFIYFNPNKIPQYDIEGSFIMLTQYIEHFGQLLPLILGLWAVYFIISHFAENKLPDSKFIPLFVILAFLTAVSSLFVCITVGVTLIFVSLYLLITTYFKGKSQTSPNNNYNVISLPFLSYWAGFATFGIYPGYFPVVFEFASVKPFLKTAFQSLILQNAFEIALLLILCTILYMLASTKTTYIKRTLFSCFSVLSGCALFFILFEGYGSAFALLTTDFLILFRLTLFALILFVFGACMREFASEKKLKNISAVIFSLLLSLFFVIQIPFTITTINLWKVMSKENKETVYGFEKMYRFYSLKGQTALLPDDVLVKIFGIKPLIDGENVNIKDNITHKTFFKYTTFTDLYYKTFYKNPTIVSYKFIKPSKALKIFYEEGGIIETEELKHLDFQKLYDDKFVSYRFPKKL